MSGNLIAQSDSWPCKRGVPGSSPGLIAHFSHPVTFASKHAGPHVYRVASLYFQEGEGDVRNITDTRFKQSYSTGMQACISYMSDCSNKSS